MTEKETSLVLSTLRLAYPHFYAKLPPKAIEATMALWHRMFAKDHYDVVMTALDHLIPHHTGYPPDIAALRKQIDDMTFAAAGEPTDEELWQMLKRAASNGYYGAQEEWAKLPPILRRYLGVPGQLRELAQMEESVLGTVVKGQFFKQIGVLRERERFDRETPEEVKALFAASYKRLPEEASPLTPEQINARRNEILNRLEQPRKD
ncbi:MAG: hypothetical protein IJW16_00100 [Clostridia bacterium]|nr:hypothetical protein [Clostridia bacterium]